MMCFSFAWRNNHRKRDHYVAKIKNLIPVTVDEKAFVERQHPEEIYDFQLSMP